MVAKLTVRHPDFSRRLQKAAREKGLGIADIQRGLKVTYEMARRYWEGIAKPRRVPALATLLDVDPAWLEYGDAKGRGVGEKVRPYEVTGLTDEVRELAVAFQRLTQVQREFYKGQIFRDAALGSIAPWLKTGRPAGETYARYERQMERDIEKRVRQLQLDLGEKP
jgi:hypothetical protein